MHAIHKNTTYYIVYSTRIDILPVCYSLSNSGPAMRPCNKGYISGPQDFWGLTIFFSQAHHIQYWLSIIADEI
jgi:hypothetical protein